jgi:hypothetical protein
VRRKLIVPHLEGATSVSAEVLAPLAVLACWRLGNGSLLRIYCNLSERKVNLPASPSKNQVIIFSTDHKADEALRAGALMPFTTVATAESRAGAPPQSGAET